MPGAPEKPTPPGPASFRRVPKHSPCRRGQWTRASGHLPRDSRQSPRTLFYDSATANARPRPGQCTVLDGAGIGRLALQGHQSLHRLQCASRNVIGPVCGRGRCPLRRIGSFTGACVQTYRGRRRMTTGTTKSHTLRPPSVLMISHSTTTWTAFRRAVASTLRDQRRFASGAPQENGS